jgi:hypothetical protein
MDNILESLQKIVVNGMKRYYAVSVIADVPKPPVVMCVADLGENSEGELKVMSFGPFSVVPPNYLSRQKLLDLIQETKSCGYAVWWMSSRKYRGRTKKSIQGYFTGLGLDLIGRCDISRNKLSDNVHWRTGDVIDFVSHIGGNDAIHTDEDD